MAAGNSWTLVYLKILLLSTLKTSLSIWSFPVYKKTILKEARGHLFAETTPLEALTSALSIVLDI